MRKRRPLRRRQFRSRTITGWVTAAAGLIMLILLLRTGSAGSAFMRQLFGIAAYALPFLLMVWGGILITRERRSARLSGGVVKAAAGLLLFCWAVGTAELLSAAVSQSQRGGQHGNKYFFQRSGDFNPHSRAAQGSYRTAAGRRGASGSCREKEAMMILDKSRKEMMHVSAPKTTGA